MGWCGDWYDDYNLVDYIDPKGSEEGKYKVIRGGCIESYACDCRSAKRNYEEPDVKDEYILKTLSDAVSRIKPN